MGASWAKNEVVAAKRRCDLIVYTDTGALADRGTDFMSLGIVYIAPGSVDFMLATGTCTNKRRPLSFAPFAFEGQDLLPEGGCLFADVLIATAHDLETGDGPFTLSNSGGALPGGLSAATDYYAIAVSDDCIRVATSLEDAYANVYVGLSSDGTGTHTLTAGATCKRGLDGLFTYEATQTETAVDASEIAVIVEGTGYSRANNGGTYTSVASVSGSTAYGSEAIEGALTRDDLLRLCARTLEAKFTKVGSLYTFRNLGDSKDSHSKEVTAAGCINATVIDAT